MQCLKDIETQTQLKQNSFQNIFTVISFYVVKHLAF